MDGTTPQAGFVTVKKCRKRGPRMDVEMEEGQTFRLPASTVLEYGIFPGHKFRSDRWLEILERAEQEECFGKLMGLLNRRAHTVFEIRRKLFKREFSAEAIAHAQARAEAAGLLDDAAFARAFADERSRGGRYGRRRIEADLSRRGVDRKLIAEAFEHLAKDTGYGADLEFESALDGARAKWRRLAKEEDRQKKRHKLLAFLAGRGFTADIAYRVLDRLGEEDREQD